MPNGKIRARSFRVLKYGEINALLLAIKARKEAMEELFNIKDKEFELEALVDLIDEYEAIEHYITSLSGADSDMFVEYLNNEKIKGKTKRSMFDRRVGQHSFRKKVLNYWGNKCSILGVEKFLIASHIKPWSFSNEHEKVDLYNGLALSPNHDKAFDSGYISFDKKGKIIISDKLIEQAGLLNINPSQKLLKYTYLHDKYMEYHRKYIFKKS